MRFLPLLRNAPIRFKLVVAILVASLAATLVAALALVAYETMTFRLRVLAEVDTWAEVLGLIMPASLTFQDPEAAEENLRTLRAIPRMSAACVYTAEGETFAAFQRAEAECPSPERSKHHSFGAGVLELFRPIHDGDHVVGYLFLEYALPPLIARLPQYGIMLAVVVLALGAVSYLVSRSTQTLIVAPIWELASTAQRVIVAKDYSARAAPRDEDEIGILTRTFNDMLDKIESNVIERRRAETALRGYSQSLEERVEERTRELDSAQEKLMRQERLAFLGQLAGGVSHELRRPLGTISNALYYLKMIHGESDEETRRHLEIIRDQIHQMDKIIHDLLDSLRVRPRAVGRVDLAAWLAEVLERYTPPDGVEVRTEIASELPSVSMDSGQMEQVISNLVTNAYQAMEDGGELGIAAERVDGGVRITVRDTGGGISDEHLKSIFEPLFTTKAQGIGLGLTISKNFVEAIGGRLEVESRVGKGSIFRIFLPSSPPFHLASEENP